MQAMSCCSVVYTQLQLCFTYNCIARMEIYNQVWWEIIDDTVRICYFSLNETDLCVQNI